MRLLILFATVVLTGCDMTGPLEPLPADAVPLHLLPAVFTRYWHEVDSCSGISRRLSDVAFYTTKAQLIEGAELGLYQQRADRITLSSVGLVDSTTVRHEMLHAHLRGRTFPNDEGHPSAYFQVRCGSLVAFYRPDHPGD